MQTDIHTTPVPKTMIWIGRVISTLVALFALWDGIMKLLKPEWVVKATVQLGFPPGTIVGIGIALLVSTVLYVIPRTAVLGAIFLTGYLGGAIASQVRIEASPFSIVFPGIFCVLAWLGLYLRESRLRALVPMRTEVA